MEIPKERASLKWLPELGAQSFPNGHAPGDFSAVFTPLFQMEGALTFGAEIDGKTAASAAGLLIQEHKKFVARVGAGTLPEFRGRGLQTALLRLRIKGWRRRAAMWQSL